MSNFVRPCCWFCIQKCSPPSRTKILSGFLRAMLAPFRVKYGYLMATLVPSWGQLRRFGCVEGYVGSLWTMKQPTDTPPKRSPLARQNQIKNGSKTQKLRQHVNLHGSKGIKRNQKSFQNPPSKRSSQWPCSLNLWRDRQNKGPP